MRKFHLFFGLLVITISLFASVIFSLITNKPKKITFQSSSTSLQNSTSKTETTSLQTQEQTSTEEQASEEFDQVIKEEALTEQKNLTDPTPNETASPENPPQTEPQKTESPSIDNSSKNFKITERFVSWGYSKADSRKIDTIIIHSSYDALGKDPYSTSGLIDEYKEYGVSAHFLVNREGKIYQLVKEKDIAYHAGESELPDGRTGVNDFSIGIELMNTKTDKYTKDQYLALNWLIKNLKNKYNIKYILGHDDIAPDRKTDPWNFDWNKIQK